MNHHTWASGSMRRIVDCRIEELRLEATACGTHSMRRTFSRHLRVFFPEPPDAVPLVPQGQTIDQTYPPIAENYGYEVELVAALDKSCRNTPAEKVAR
jgi:2-keto-4-pentenoate hydratase/2-oxohepta-3-ene-1,7-dioic acid hydratase in catechol pathway